MTHLVINYQVSQDGTILQEHHVPFQIADYRNKALCDTSIDGQLYAYSESINDK